MENKYIQVKQFDEELAKKELKNCPKIVQDYVRLLNEHNNKWKDLYYTAIKRIKELSNNGKQTI